jgi:hypothetical protein
MGSLELIHIIPSSHNAARWLELQFHRKLQDALCISVR